MSELEQNIVYADENARIAWEVGKEVTELNKELPPEGPDLNAQTIYFDNEYEARGTYAIFFAGTVIGTAHWGEFVVPERSLIILETLRIPYKLTNERR